MGEEEEPQLVIRGGRHPVLDAVMDEPVVPNDTCLRGAAGPRAAIITGPNMGGKSCYIRQAALIALMAQVAPAWRACSRLPMCRRCCLHLHQAAFCRHVNAGSELISRCQADGSSEDLLQQYPYMLTAAWSMMANMSLS